MVQKKLRRTGAVLLAACMMFGSVPVTAFHAHAADTPSSVVSGITGATLNEEGTAIAMPTVPEGMSIRFCADYEQVISEEGEVYQPLEDKTVKGFFEVSSGEGDSKITAKTGEFSVNVRGTYHGDNGGNPKPEVIPELQEWHGESGMFLLRPTAHIVADADLKDTAEIFAADLKDITGKELPVVTGTEADIEKGDFYLTLNTEDEGLGDEGYLMTVGDSVKIEAKKAVGAYWGTVSVLQILKQTKNHIAKGVARDYPKYEVRAFMLDVGRKPFSMDAVKQFAKNMSWYKMNSFQLHLNDNLIFHEDYPTMQEAIDNSYAAFRMESEIETTGEALTAKDVYYKKDEFRSFIKDSRKIGIDVVPEFDMPAHALAITRAFPEIMTKKSGGQHSYLIEEMDLSKPETTEIARRIWGEYLNGDDPVFDKETTIHIGTDEFHGSGGNEAFRKFSDDMIAMVQESGRKVRMWGSLTNKGGTTPVRSQGVQLNIWDAGYANPRAMYDQGFDMINTLADQGGSYGMYIVPSGTNSDSSTYSDYLNVQKIYNNWQPNNFNGYTVKAGEDQMLGGCYAEWHDNIDTRANGISEYDSFDRFFKALPSVASKLWTDPEKSYDEFTETAEKTGTAPNTNMYYEVESKTATVLDYSFDDTLTKDDSGNGYDVTEQKNVSQASAEGKSVLQLNGGESYLTTPVDKIGPDNSLTMMVKMDADAQGEQILCESWEPMGNLGTYAVKAVQKETGKVGFSREGYDFSFNYTLEPGTWTKLTVKGHQNTAELYVDDVLVDTLEQTQIRSNNYRVNTLVMPVGRIGSKTNSFKGQIDYMTAGTAEEEDQVEDENYLVIPQSEMEASACSEADQYEDTEGPASFAIDGRTESYWHSNWRDDKTVSEDAPHWLKVTFKNNASHIINRLTYLPRQDRTNGRIFKYGVEVTDASGNTKMVTSGEWADDYSLKEAVFEPVNAKSIKLYIYNCTKDDVGNNAVIAELNVYKTIEAVLDEYQEKFSQKGEYTEESWAAFIEVYNKVQEIVETEDATEEALKNAISELNSAWNGLCRIGDEELVEQLIAVEQADTSGADQTFVQRLEAAKRNLENAIGNDTADKNVVITELMTAKAAAELSAEVNRGADVTGKTKESVDVYNQALAKAKELLINDVSEVTAKELEDALAQLKEAKDGLTKADPTPGGDKPTPTPGDDKPTPTPGPTPTPDPTPNPTPSVPAAGTVITVKDVQYKVTKSDAQNGTAAAVKLMKKTAKKITIQSAVTIDGVTFKVTEVNAKVFQKATKLTTVTIGANVKKIGAKAFFKCAKLKKVTFKGTKAPSIGKQAFKGTVAKCKVTAPKKMAKKQKKLLKTRLKKAGISKKAVIK